MSFWELFEYFLVKRENILEKMKARTNNNPLCFLVCKMQILFLTASMFILETFALIFMRAKDSFLVFAKQKEEGIFYCNYSYSRHKQIKKKVRFFTRTSFICILISTILTSTVLYYLVPDKPSADAANFNLIQSNWSGGQDQENFPVHPDNQTDWTKYYDKDNLVSATDNISLISLNTNDTITETSDTDFNDGTFSNTTVSGTGDEAELLSSASDGIYISSVNDFSSGTIYDNLSFSYGTSNETLSYWIDTEVEKVWVKTDSLPAKTTAYFDVWKRGSESSDGENTFVLYDDFNREDSSEVGGSWTSTGSSSIVNGEVLMGYDTSIYQPFDSRGHVIECEYTPNGNNGAEILGTFNGNQWCGYGGWEMPWDNAITLRDHVTVMRGPAVSYIFPSQYSTYNMRLDFTTGYGAKFYIWEKGSDSADATTISYQEYTPTYTNQNVAIGSNTYTATPTFDNFRVRKYAAIDPVVTVEDMGSFYRVSVYNDNDDTLTDFQVSVDATDLDVTSTSESLEITDYISSPTFRIRSASTLEALDSATWYGPTSTSDYYTTAGQDINDIHNEDRYLQYQLYLPDRTTVQDVSISYTTPQTLISSPYYIGSDSSTLSGISWSENKPEGSTIQFQLRSTTNNGNLPNDSNWTDYIGPDGTPDTYFTDHTGNDTIPEELSTGADDEWLQYKVYLLATNELPTVDDIVLEYAANNQPQVSAVSASQDNDNTGFVTIQTSVDDAEDDDTIQMKVEYSLDGGLTWNDPTLITGSISSTQFTFPDINNDNNYQIGGTIPIKTSIGVNTIIFKWDTRIDGLLYETSVKMRITVTDGTDVGASVTGAVFAVDNQCGTAFVPPSGPNVSNIEIVELEDGVTVLKNIPDDIYQIAISRTPDFKNVSWQDFDEEKFKTIDSNPETLYVKFRNKSGGVSDVVIYGQSNNSALKDGDIVKTENNPDVYIIKIINDQRFIRLILSPKVFNSYEHLKWENIKTISQTELNNYTISNLVQVKGDKNIYKLIPNGDTGTKTIYTGNYSIDSIYEINEVDRESYVLE